MAGGGVRRGGPRRRRSSGGDPEPPVAGRRSSYAHPLLAGGRRDAVPIGTLESTGGVRAAEADCDPAELAEAHDRYAAERDAAIPEDHEGHRPSGGVGGTRQGVKCLHAHYAWFLAGGDDPVGRWVHARLQGRPASTEESGG